MKRSLWLLSCLVMGGVLSWTRAADLDALKAEKKNLDDQRKQGVTRQQQAAARVANSDALAAERTALEQARKALASARTENADVARAQKKLDAAKQDLAERIDKTAEKSSEAAQLRKALDGAMANATELRFQKQLLSLQLNHEGSPIRMAVEEDKELARLRAAAADLERQIADKPAAETAAAQRTLAEAQTKLAPLAEAVNANADLKSAAQAEAAARQALSREEAQDSTRAAITKARVAWEDAKARKLQDIKEAKPHTSTLESVAEQRAGVREALRGMDYALEALGQSAVAGKDSEVAPALDAKEKAEKQYAKALESAALRKLKDAADQAAKDYDARHDEWFGKNAEYVKLTQQADALKTKLAELDKRVPGIASEPDAGKLAREIQAVRQQQRDAEAQRRALRISIGKEKWDEVYRVRSAARRALEIAAGEHPEAAAALQARARASAELDAIVGRKVGASKAGAAILAARRALVKKEKELLFQEAIAKHYLYSPDSAINQQVDADRGVLKALAQYEEARKDAAEKQPKAVAKAEGDLQTARAKLGEVRGKLEQDAKFQEASKAMNAAERALRQTRDGDPRRAQFAQARAAADARLVAATAEQKDAKPLLEKLASVDKAIDEGRQAASDAPAKMKALKAQIEKSDDSDIVKARKKVEEAQQALAAAKADVDKSKAVTDAQTRIGEAEKALAAKKTDLAAKDPEVQAAARDIAEVEKKAQAVSDQIRDLEKKARKQADEKKAAEPKKDAGKQDAEKKAEAEKPAAK